MQFAANLNKIDLMFEKAKRRYSLVKNRTDHELCIDTHLVQLTCKYNAIVKGKQFS